MAALQEQLREKARERKLMAGKLELLEARYRQHQQKSE